MCVWTTPQKAITLSTTCRPLLSASFKYGAWYCCLASHKFMHNWIRILAMILMYSLKLKLAGIFQVKPMVLNVNIHKRLDLQHWKFGPCKFFLWHLPQFGPLWCHNKVRKYLLVSRSIDISFLPWIYY